jgi:hypothetical protein
MTLLINEIHAIDSLQNSFILNVADRRLTDKNTGEWHGNHRKIFEIPYLNAGVGYFGVAAVSNKEYFSSWLPNFIKRNANVRNLSQFAHALRDTLNRVVDKTFLKDRVSGFHICGYNAEHFPEFWIVRNTDRFENGVYRDFKTEYYCDEEFLKRDARSPDVGFDGVSPVIPGYVRQYYINGDIRPFHLIWGELDKFLYGMFAFESFSSPKTQTEMEEVAKWKLSVIASFYKKFARRKLIGTPIDAFILLPK